VIPIGTHAASRAIQLADKRDVLAERPCQQTLDDDIVVPFALCAENDVGWAFASAGGDRGTNSPLANAALLKRRCRTLDRVVRRARGARRRLAQRLTVREKPATTSGAS